MYVVPIADLRPTPGEVGGSVDGAMAKLLGRTEQPRIAKWVQFPNHLVVFLIVPAGPESRAFYIDDRRAKVWLWLDFDDEKFGGYTVSDCDRLVGECRFLDIVEHPQLLQRHEHWVIQLGLQARRSGGIAEVGMKKPS